MRSYLLIIFLFISVLSYSQVPTKGIFVLPAILEYNLSLGQVGTKTLNVQNRTDSSAQFRLYFADWRRDTAGRHQYFQPGLLEMSCAEWISIDKEFIEVPSGGNVPITVTMKIPDSTTSVKEMKWAMLFVEVVNEKKAFQDTGLSSAIIPIYRLGIHVLQTPPNLGRKEIRMVAFDKIKFENDSLGFNITCQNVGEVQLKAKCSIEFTNLSDGTKSKLGPDPISVFPGARRVITYKVPSTLARGKYSVLAILDGGDEMPIEAAQSEIEIK